MNTMAALHQWGGVRNSLVGMNETVQKPPRCKGGKQSIFRGFLADHPYRNDALIVICASVAMTFLGGYLDFFELWHAFVRQHENWELDEITIGIFSLAILLVWYSWRRQTQANLLKSIALKHKEEAIEASLAKSRFLTTMSHELRTPLNSIIGYSEAMLTGALGKLGNEKHEECLRDVHNSGNHLLDLINDILDLSKIEAKKEVLEERLIEVPVMMDNSLKRVRILAEKKNITLCFDAPESPPKLLGDERRVVQVFINLLSNAIKFTPENGQVTFVAENDEESSYIFRVSDTGTGIPKGEIPNVVKPFEQTGDKSSETRAGTGLGLAISNSLVLLHGGELAIASELGKGTTVTVHFPPERSICPS